MNKNKFSLFLILLIASISAWAQTDESSHMTEVSGVVTDFQTREPLIGVTVCEERSVKRYRNRF